MDKRLDIDSGWNTTVFHRCGTDDWGYRRLLVDLRADVVAHAAEQPGHRIRARRAPGAAALERVMNDLVHTIGDEPMDNWLSWKAANPDIFTAQEAS